MNIRPVIKINNPVFETRLSFVILILAYYEKGLAYIELLTKCAELLNKSVEMLALEAKPPANSPELHSKCSKLVTNSTELLANSVELLANSTVSLTNSAAWLANTPEWVTNSAKLRLVFFELMVTHSKLLALRHSVLLFHSLSIFFALYKMRACYFDYLVVGKLNNLED